MIDRYLYVCTIPADAQTATGTETQNQLATHGLLESDSGAVDAISTAPSDESVELRYFGPYAEQMATEVTELANNTNYAPMPYHAGTETTPTDAYYSVSSDRTGRAEPQTDAFASVSVNLTKDGTREGKRRAVRTTIRGPVENPWGNDETAYLGIPGDATEVQWLASDGSERTEPVTVVETRACEYGSVEIVDVQASSFTDPSLVYDQPYHREGKVDVVVWDDHDRAKFDSDGVNSWQWVFATSHDFTGRPRVENGLVRVEFDAANNSLGIEEWDDANTTWTDVSLGTSDWEFDQYDITRISPVWVDAQCRFIDPSVSPTAEYYLDMSLKRGYWWPQWTRTPSATEPVPSGLLDLLAPAANESDYEPQAEQGLVDSSEVGS